MSKIKKLRGAEILYAFGVWLTTRKKVSGPFSSRHDTTPMIQLIGEFLQYNDMDGAREGYERAITFPPEK